MCKIGTKLMLKLTQWRHNLDEKEYAVYICPLSIDAIRMIPRSVLRVDGGGARLCTWVQVANMEYGVEEEDITVRDMMEDSK